MERSKVEVLNDEELLDLYQSTLKIFESLQNQGESSARKQQVLQARLGDIESEMKVRSLWEGQEQ